MVQTTSSARAGNKSVIILVWLMLTMSMGLYAVLLSVAAGGDKPPVAGSDVVRTGMTFFAGAMALVSIFVRRILLGTPRLRAELSKLPLPESDTETAFALAIPKLTQKWFVGNIVSWAINETIVMCGFMVAMVMRDFNAYLPFLVVGVIMNLAMRPKLEAFETTVQKWIVELES